ncbi:MAG: HDOD domain-containing protein [Cyanobacteria bacterium]|nr:HDOD domain-containing protein [Cyanobacteriota bacterium]
MSLVEEDIAKKLDSLPASSPAVTKLISIIDNPTTTRDDVLRLLTLDQVLFAHAFKYANSAALGSCRKLVSLTEIVDVLGFSALKSIAILTALRNISTNRGQWFNAIFTALAAKRIAITLSKEAEFCEDVFMAAMMQQYGLFAIMNFYPKEYKKINQSLSYNERLKQETKLFGYNHLELSTRVLEIWGLPKKIVSVVANQESQENDQLNKYNQIIDIARAILESGRFKNENNFKDFIKTNKKLLSELKLKIGQDFIDEIFTDAHNLMTM